VGHQVIQALLDQVVQAEVVVLVDPVEVLVTQVHQVVLEQADPVVQADHLEQVVQAEHLVQAVQVDPVVLQVQAALAVQVVLLEQVEVLVVPVAVVLVYL
jgi:hypothetical protein